MIEEIEDLNPAHVSFSDVAEDCLEDNEMVCFGGAGGCNIEVNELGNYVTKNGKTVYYEGPLIYGAIFSESEIYECQVERLMQRNAELAYLYADKTEFLSGKGCPSNLKPELLSFASELQFEEGDTSSKLTSIYDASKILESRNELLKCELF